MIDRNINKKDLQVGRLMVITCIKKTANNRQRCFGEAIDDRQRLFYKNIDLLTGNKYKYYLDNDCKESDIVIYNNYELSLIATIKKDKIRLSEAIDYAYCIAGVEKKLEKPSKTITSLIDKIKVKSKK